MPGPWKVFKISGLISKQRSQVSTFTNLGAVLPLGMVAGAWCWLELSRRACLLTHIAGSVTLNSPHLTHYEATCNTTVP